jgi:phosphoglycerate dehydrogenase-like enzyme
MTYGEDLTEEIIAECHCLRWIMVLSAGLEKMPMAALLERGIFVTNARGIHATPMSEYVMAVLLQLTRKTDTFMALQREKRWDRTVRVDELAGKSLVIAGAGAIGEAIAHKAKAFAMRTVGVNTSGKPRPGFDVIFPSSRLHEALAEGDFVVLTVPLTEKTRGWIGAEELAAMKPSAWLINIARGAVVREADLLAALQNGTIAGAVLDVFEQEPLPESHPFWTMPNVILTPHISGRSPLYMTRALEIFRHNLRVYLNGGGNFINLIDLARGY